MALPLLPEKDIPIEFAKLEVVSNKLKMPKLCKLVAYMKSNWIYGKMWNIKDFCHFRMKIRTNNDVEASHITIMSHARVNHMPFYLLVQQLFQEAEYIKFQVARVWNNECVTKRKRKTVQREKFLSLMWEKLDLGLVNAT